MRPPADRRAGFKSLGDLRLCILAFVSLREAADVGLPLKPLKPAAPARSPMAADRLQTPVDLEQRSGRAIRHSHTPDTVHIFYYSAAWLACDSPLAEPSTTGPQEPTKERRGR